MSEGSPTPEIDSLDPSETFGRSEGYWAWRQMQTQKGDLDDSLRSDQAHDAVTRALEEAQRYGPMAHIVDVDRATQALLDLLSENGE